MGGRFAVLSATAALACGTAAAISTAHADSVAAGSAAAADAAKPDGKLTMDVQFTRFTVKGRRMSARATANATLTSGSGERTSTRRSVSFTAAVARSCKILHLRLDQLYLSLLGLNAKLDRVTLDITGRPSGGVLGALFCKLARAVPRISTKKTEHALAAQLRKHRRLARMHFTMYLHRQYAEAPPASAAQTQPVTCPVLNLIVGPLNLELLGLVVDLNRVKLDVTATRGGGKLGDTFCQLSGAPSTTSTTTTPAPA
jgi:hypothetical protein